MGAAVSIHDFVVTVDTQASGGDKLVVHLDRAGQPRLTLACGAAQLVWIIDDPEQFELGYRMTLARGIVECHAAGWTFDLLARELGITPGDAALMHQRALDAAAEAAAEAAALEGREPVEVTA